MSKKSSIKFLDGTNWAWYLPKCMQCFKKVDRIKGYNLADNGDWYWEFECHGEVCKVRISEKIYRYAHKIAIVKVFLLLFLSLLLTSPPVKAQSLTIVNVGGYLGVTDEEVTDIYKYASYYFKEIGITFRLKRYDYATNPCWQYHSPLLYVLAKELQCLKDYGVSQGHVRRKMLTYFILPPLITVEEAYGPQTAWIAGLAEGICGKVALGNAINERYNNGIHTGEDRLPHSATILAHEIGHLMCATHQDYTPNLMHFNANAFTTEYHGQLPVLRITKRQVKRGMIKARRRA